jgi:hypothetical protein
MQCRAMLQMQLASRAKWLSWCHSVPPLGHSLDLALCLQQLQCTQQHLTVQPLKLCTARQ